ncbi:unnamed protein product [Amoebophrya sp. A25]|nr:unnamed protein product [Amoebophrya sp. A25]|eukprot:GSA25T00025202001.1
MLQFPLTRKQAKQQLQRLLSLQNELNENEILIPQKLIQRAGGDKAMMKLNNNTTKQSKRPAAPGSPGAPLPKTARSDNASEATYQTSTFDSGRATHLEAREAYSGLFRSENPTPSAFHAAGTDADSTAAGTGATNQQTSASASSSNVNNNNNNNKNNYSFNTPAPNRLNFNTADDEPASSRVVRPGAASSSSTSSAVPGSASSSSNQVPPAPFLSSAEKTTTTAAAPVAQETTTTTTTLLGGGDEAASAPVPMDVDQDPAQNAPPAAAAPDLDNAVVRPLDLPSQVLRPPENDIAADEDDDNADTDAQEVLEVTFVAPHGMNLRRLVWIKEDLNPEGGERKGEKMSLADLPDAEKSITDADLSWIQKEDKHGSEHAKLFRRLEKIVYLTMADAEDFDASCALAFHYQTKAACPGWIKARAELNELVIWLGVEFSKCSMRAFFADRNEAMKRSIQATDSGKEFLLAALDYERPYLRHRTDPIVYCATSGTLQDFFEIVGRFTQSSGVCSAAEKVADKVAENADKLGITSGLALHQYCLQEAQSALPKGVVANPLAVYTMTLKAFKRGLVAKLFDVNGKPLNNKIMDLFNGSKIRIQDAATSTTRLQHDAPSVTKYLCSIATLMSNYVLFIDTVLRLPTNAQRQNIIRQASSNLLLQPLAIARKQFLENPDRDLQKMKDFNRLAQSITTKLFEAIFEPVLIEQLNTLMDEQKTMKDAEIALNQLHLKQFTVMKDACDESLREIMLNKYTSKDVQVMSPAGGSKSGGVTGMGAGVCKHVTRAPESDSSGDEGQ